MIDGHTGRLEAALDGKYRIERKLGEGGMASVYLASDIKHERKVALKILKPELAAVIGAERFLSEIKTTANLQHPHILALFDSGEADSYLYYVMPYIDGETLRERIEREGQLGVDESIRIARDVADALDYAHRNDIIHRDIKPANILLHDGRPVVADFGIALAISAAGGGRMTETGLSLGTPHYMSPEQASADRDLSARSDVYSLGCVLYEMLAGQPPHTGPSAQSILVRILTEDPRDVLELRRTVPAHVAATVMKSIEKLPADRFDTARQFMDALEDESFRHTVRQSGAQTVVTPVPASVAGAGGRPGWALTGALAVIAVIVGFVVGGSGGGAPATDGPSPVRAAIDLDGVELPGSFAEIVVSPDGSALATPSGSEGPLYVRRVDEPDFRALPGTEGGFYPTFSPDGAWIAYMGDDQGLYKISIDGGRPQTVVPESDEYSVFFPHWGDDGTIVFVSGIRSLYRVSENGGTPEVIWEGAELTPPRLLPGGRAVIGGGLGGEQVVRMLEIGSDSLVTLVPEGVDPTYVETGHILYGHPESGLWAVPFDLEALETTGPARPVVDGVASGVAARYSIARNGTLVYATGEGMGGFTRPDRRLLIVDLESASIDTLPLAPRPLGGAAFSPDGGKIAFAEILPGGGRTGSHIHTYDLVLGGPTPLTFERERNMSPVWSPDGTRIAFSSIGEADLDVFVKPLDGSTAAVPLIEREGAQILRDWLDDDVLVFDDGDFNNWDIFLRPLDGDTEAVTPFLQAEWSEFGLKVSPDGRWATYVSLEAEASEVYVRRFPDATGQNRVSVGGGRAPRWSADGGTIYYQNGRDTIWAAQVRFDPTFLVLGRAPAYVGNVGEFNVHPTESKLLVAEALPRNLNAEGEPEPERWFIVVNWFEELRARLGEGG